LKNHANWMIKDTDALFFREDIYFKSIFYGIF
jgi:hypothetical protein